jgi:hypothetical protein
MCRTHDTSSYPGAKNQNKNPRHSFQFSEKAKKRSIKYLQKILSGLRV